MNNIRAENKVPAIRFEGFSGEWDTCRLDVAATVERGKFSVRPRNDPRYFGGDIPFVQTGDIVSSNRRLRSFSQTLNEKGLAVSKSFPKNSILMTIVANIGDLAITDFSVACPDSVVAIHANDDFYTDFLFDFLGTKKGDLEGVATTNAQANINLQVLNPLKIVRPALNEQTKIGNYFQQLDTLIAQHQKKHDKLLNLKKALLEKLFPKQGATKPEIRFKGLGGEWVEKKLKNIIDGMTGGASIAPSDYQEEGIRTIPKGAVNSTGVADLSGSKCITLGFYEENILSKASSGDLVASLRDLVPIAPNMGRIVKVQSPKEDFLMPQGVYKIVLEEEVNEAFVIAYSNSELFRKIIAREKNGSTQVHIRNGEFLDIEITMPMPEEQTKIGNLFKQLDTLITQHQSQLKKLNNIKQACLEKMFV